jgi:hypothetical protein
VVDRCCIFEIQEKKSQSYGWDGFGGRVNDGVTSEWMKKLLKFSHATRRASIKLTRAVSE